MQVDEDGSREAAAAKTEGDATRRAAMVRLAKTAAYVAPVTLGVLKVNKALAASSPPP